MMIQTIYRGELWKMLACCVMLNKSQGVVVKKIMRTFFELCPTIEILCQTEEALIADFLRPSGFQNSKARKLKRLANELMPGFENSRRQVTDFYALGYYAQQSYETFVLKKPPVSVIDKEIKRYVETMKEGYLLVRKIKNEIVEAGVDVVVAGKLVREMLDYWYEFDTTYCFRLDDVQSQYVKDKLALYKNDLQNVISILKNDNYSRQAVIQFSQAQPEPNCTVSLHFLIRGKNVYVFAYQRSQDVKKIEMDCEILSLMTLEVIKAIEGLDDYKIKVFVGNMHLYHE